MESKDPQVLPVSPDRPSDDETTKNSDGAAGGNPIGDRQPSSIPATTHVEDEEEEDDWNRRAFRDLRKRELDWLWSLPAKKKLMLNKRFDTKTNSGLGAHHIQCSGDMAFTIIGEKPCSLIHNDKATWFGAEMVKNVLQPWMAAWKAEEQGFKAEKITGHLYPSEINGHPGFKGSWAFFNTKHDGYEFAHEMFIESALDEVSFSDIQIALGAPGSDAAEHENSGYVYYMAQDCTPYREPGKPKQTICCIPLWQYLCKPGDADDAGAHFRKAADAIRDKLDICISMDIDSCKQWPHRALAGVMTGAFEDRKGFHGALHNEEFRMFQWIRTELPLVVQYIPGTDPIECTEGEHAYFNQR